MTAATLPDFDSLPPVEGFPQGCAWGLFDADGKKDTLGTLNLLDVQTVRKAAQEIVVGESVSLKSVIRLNLCLTLLILCCDFARATPQQLIFLMALQLANWCHLQTRFQPPPSGA